MSEPLTVRAAGMKAARDAHAAWLRAGIGQHTPTLIEECPNEWCRDHVAALTSPTLDEEWARVERHLRTGWYLLGVTKNVAGHWIADCHAPHPEPGYVMAKGDTPVGALAALADALEADRCWYPSCPAPTSRTTFHLPCENRTKGVHRQLNGCHEWLDHPGPCSCDLHLAISNGVRDPGRDADAQEVPE